MKHQRNASIRCLAILSLLGISLVAFSCAAGARARPDAASPGSSPAPGKPATPDYPVVGAIAAVSPGQGSTTILPKQSRTIALALGPGQGKSVTQIMAPDRVRGFVRGDGGSRLVYLAGAEDSLSVASLNDLASLASLKSFANSGSMESFVSLKSVPSFTSTSAVSMWDDGTVAFQVFDNDTPYLFVHDPDLGLRIIRPPEAIKGIYRSGDSESKLLYLTHGKYEGSYLDYTGANASFSVTKPVNAGREWKASIPGRAGFQNGDLIDKGEVIAYKQSANPDKLSIGAPYYFFQAWKTGSVLMGPYAAMGNVESWGEGKSAAFAFSARVEGESGTYIVLARPDGTERRFGPYESVIDGINFPYDGNAIFGPDGALYFAVKEDGLTRLLKDGEEILRCKKLRKIEFAEGENFPDGDGSIIAPYFAEDGTDFYIQRGGERMGPFKSEPWTICSAGGHWLVICEFAAYYDGRKLISGSFFNNAKLSMDGSRYAFQFREYSYYSSNDSENYHNYYFNGTKYGPFESIGSDIALDPQVRSFVLSGKTLDGKASAIGPAGRGASAGYIGAIALAPDARRAAWTAIDYDEKTKAWNTAILIDGKVVSAWNGKNRNAVQIGKLRFSQDGRALAIEAWVDGQNRYILVVDGAVLTGTLSLDLKTAYFVEGDAIVSIPCGE